ncbi:MAG: hypothetical protein IPP42_14970 [Saprospiraceae bacterium]|nr:hypothetical protein [Saprospiraceae bacterium]
MVGSDAGLGFCLGFITLVLTAATAAFFVGIDLIFALDTAFDFTVMTGFLEGADLPEDFIRAVAGLFFFALVGFEITLALNFDLVAGFKAAFLASGFGLDFLEGFDAGLVALALDTFTTFFEIGLGAGFFSICLLCGFCSHKSLIFKT